jgi:outer membrane lipoprotein-sorting protein
MLLTKHLLLAILLFFADAGVFAQNANDIINKNIEAMGGKDKLSHLNSVYEEMTNSVMGQEIPAKIWIVNEKGMRTEMTVMGQQMITVVTTDTGWMINPMTGNNTPQPLPSNMLKQSLGKMDLRGQLMDYMNKGFTATLLGKEADGSKEAYKIRLIKSGQPTFTFYIDVSSYLISKIATEANANGQKTAVTIVMSDYRKTPEGYFFPFLTTIEAGSGEIKSQITKLTINPAVDPSLFAKK